MTKNRIFKPLITTAFVVLFFYTGIAQAAPVIGEPAPAFSGTDIDGNTVSLTQYKGKTVILEWFNQDCPYVRKHYDSGNMQDLQKTATDDGMIWLTIASSAPGKQGHTTAAEAKAIIEKEGSHETTRLLDPEGTIGRLYEARTTPHMFVINPDGILIYMGAIDDMPTTKPDSLNVARNYVTPALQAAKAGTMPKITTSQPYGCSVKY